MGVFLQWEDPFVSLFKSQADNSKDQKAVTESGKPFKL